MQWAAPERFLGKAGPASDVYSFGVICWEMFSAGPPFAGIPPMVLIRTQNELALPIKKSGCPDAVIAVIRGCFDKVPEKRPPLSAVIKALEAAVAAAPAAPVPSVLTDAELKSAKEDGKTEKKDVDADGEAIPSRMCIICFENEVGVALQVQCSRLSLSSVSVSDRRCDDGVVRSRAGMRSSAASACSSLCHARPAARKSRRASQSTSDSCAHSTLLLALLCMLSHVL